MKFSIIIPLYNRPQEIEELLGCLCNQTYKDFEVWVIEDGSNIPAEHIVNSFKAKIDVKYIFKENSGQGFSRNVGFEHATGDYFIIFDSDILLENNYLEIVADKIVSESIDCYGGPDKEHSSFTNTQKAISYAMTSILTTGGIRGGKAHVGKFTPRSFNMGLSRKVYEKVGGFAIPRMAEDLEYSIRIQQAGFNTALIPEAFVYHKRRTSLAQFFKQLKFFGRARINLYRFYKSELKWVHFFPMVFLVLEVCMIGMVVAQSQFWQLSLGVYVLYFALNFFYSLMLNKSIQVAFLSLFSVWIQLNAYGYGFIIEAYRYWIKGITQIQTQ